LGLVQQTGALHLHGLGHLHHPDTGELVQSYIARNPGLDPEIKDYALAAAKFSVM
jgi:hypothetical protein